MKNESWMLRILVFVILTIIAILSPNLDLLYAYLPAPPIQKTCPICGTRFLFSGTMSMTQFGNRLDHKPLGAVGPPCQLPICPYDHFVLYKSKFKPNEIEALKKLVNSPAYQNQAEGHSECYLLARTYEFIGESSKKIAWAYLQASWQAEDKNPEKYNDYLSKSIEHFEVSLKKHKNCKKALISDVILCAELERRLSRFDAARKRLARVKPIADGIVHQKTISYELKLIDAKDNASHEHPYVKEIGKAHKHFYRGISALSAKQYDQAIHEFNQAINLEPDNPDFLYHRSLAYREKGLYDDSIKDLNSLICIDPDKTSALINRSSIYIRKGAYDEAIKDCERVIRLNPKNASAYHNRGNAYSHKGYYDKSIENYNTAIILSPDPSTYWNRGIDQFLQGEFFKAGKDFEQSLGLGRKDPFCTIFLFISRKRSGQDGEKELANIASTFDSIKWPAPIISMFLNHTTPEIMLRETKHSDKRIQRERECEAFFFTGQYYLLKEKSDKAKRMFQKSIDTGVKEFVEYRAAKHELERLKK